MGWVKELLDESGRRVGWRAFESEGSGLRKVQANATRPTKKAAQIAARTKLAEKLNGIETHEDEPFDALADDYLELEGSDLGLTTLDRYKSILRRHLRPYFGRKIATSIDPTMVLKFRARQRKAGLAPNTVRNHMTVLSGVLDFGVRTKRLPYNAAEAVREKRRPEVQTPRRALTVDELKQLLTKALELRDRPPGKRERSNRYLYALCLLAATAGLRRGELIALRRADLRLDDAVLLLRESVVKVPGSPSTRKGTKARREKVRPILLPPVMVEALRAELRRQAPSLLKDRTWNRERLVFPSRAGKVRNPDAVSHDVAALMAACKIEDCDLHSLRHTHSTMLRDAGVDPLTIRDRQGHADLATTEGYIHASVAVQEGAAASLERLLS